MRRQFVNIVVMLTFFLGSGFKLTSPQQDMFKSIEAAIALGSAEKLTNYLSTSVELELPDEEEGIYSKSQAVLVLSNFFDQNPPVSFNFEHKGSSAAGSRYAVGVYLTMDEKTYRVTIFMQKAGSEYLIREIEFE